MSNRSSLVLFYFILFYYSNRPPYKQTMYWWAVYFGQCPSAHKNQRLTIYSISENDRKSVKNLLYFQLSLPPHSLFSQKVFPNTSNHTSDPHYPQRHNNSLLAPSFSTISPLTAAIRFTSSFPSCRNMMISPVSRLRQPMI